MWKEGNISADICERILLWMVHQRFRYGEVFLRIQNIASAMNMTAREVREYLDILHLSGRWGVHHFRRVHLNCGLLLNMSVILFVQIMLLNTVHNQ